MSRAYDPCTERYSKVYFNLPEVQAALHANVTALAYPWKTCRYILFWFYAKFSPLKTNMIWVTIFLFLCAAMLLETTGQTHRCQCFLFIENSLLPVLKYGCSGRDRIVAHTRSTDIFCSGLERNTLDLKARAMWRSIYSFLDLQQYFRILDIMDNYGLDI